MSHQHNFQHTESGRTGSGDYAIYCTKCGMITIAGCRSSNEIKQSEAEALKGCPFPSLSETETKKGES